MNLKKCILIIVSAILIAGTVGAAKMGVLIAAHGAPMPGWNRPLLKLGETVRAMVSNKAEDLDIRVGFLEFAEPSLAQIVELFETAGVDRVLVIPVFTAPSSHTERDLPAALGLYTDTALRKSMKEEGVTPLRTTLPITITAPLSEGDLIPRIIADRCAALSSNSACESVLILAHGDPMWRLFYGDMLRRTAFFVSAKTGISSIRWASIGLGQGFLNATPILEELADKDRTVIIAGVYVASDVERLVRPNAIIRLPDGRKIDTLEGKNIRWCRGGLLPDRRVAEWIVSKITESIHLPNQDK